MTNEQAANELPAKLAQKLAKQRIVDPVKRARREEVDARNRRLQEAGIKQPKSGVFGRPPK